MSNTNEIGMLTTVSSILTQSESKESDMTSQSSSANSRYIPSPSYTLNGSQSEYVDSSSLAPRNELVYIILTNCCSKYQYASFLI